MKVSNDSLTTQLEALQKTTQQVSANTKTSDDAKSRATAKHPTHLLMQQWFSKVGIATGQPLPDHKYRQQIIERRRNILSLQAINNLQAVLNSALEVSMADIAPSNLDPDWFFNFARMAEQIHSPAMQALWGKIFAVEIQHPGSFSLRSLETLQRLTQRDARLFSKAVKLACRKSGDTVPRILIGYHQRRSLRYLLSGGLLRASSAQVNLSSLGVSYPDMLALIDMKLIYASEIESGEFAAGTVSQWRYQNTTFTLQSKRSGLALAYYKFTTVGSELAHLISRQPHEQYLSSLGSVLRDGFNMNVNGGV